jgi:hypothetical protein
VAKRDSHLLSFTPQTMVGVAHIPRNREKTLASSPQTASAAVDGGNQLHASGEQEKIKPLVVLAAAVAAIGGK